MTTDLYPGITQRVCNMAFNFQTAALNLAAGTGVANKFAGTFVVLNPHAQASDVRPSPKEVANATLFIRQIDPDRPDAAKYDEIALGKAGVLWGLRPVLGSNFTTREVQQNYPHLYLSDMVKYGGGICRNGVIYAFSGVQPNYDEAFALSVAAWVEAMCREAMVEPNFGVMKQDGARIPQLPACTIADTYWEGSREPTG